VSKRLYFVAGEASGDEHGAALLRALREIDPDLIFHGRGGPQMQSLVPRSFLNWIDAAGVVGLWEVLKSYGYFRAQFQDALREVAEIKPDAVVLIDYPGFNLRLARGLRQRSPHPKIIYYISPQVWAWNRGRIRQMARYLDLMLCIFPFEADLYNQSGLRTIFVGHPMMETLAARRTENARDPNLIALLPGSRVREVRKNFPIMIDAAVQMMKGRGNLRFEIAAASGRLATEIGNLLGLSALRDRFEIVTGDSAGLMQRATAGIIASGTATLEATYFRLPFVLVYKVAWPTYFAARWLMTTKYLGMPNVLAGREIVPEFLQHKARPRTIADSVWRLIDDPAVRQAMIAEFDAIIARLGERGASEKAAAAILEVLGENEPR